MKMWKKFTKLMLDDILTLRARRKLKDEEEWSLEAIIKAGERVQRAELDLQGIRPPSRDCV